MQKVSVGRKVMKRIFVFGFVACFGMNLFGTTHTEKTFLMPQPMRIPTQHTLYDYGQHRMAESSELWGAHLQVTGFFRRDQNKSDIGKYFGRNGRNNVQICFDPAPATCHQSSELVHNAGSIDDLKLKGCVELNPYRKMRGVHFSYLQQLTKVSKNLFFNIHAPLVHVTNRVNTKMCDQKKVKINGVEKGLVDYFAGRLVQVDNPNKQEALKYAKIDVCKKHSRTDIADVEALLSYQFEKNDHYYLRPFAGVVIPTSNKPTGEYLFEPVTGHGRQWGIGGGVEAMATLYKDDDTSFDLTCAYHVKHFFSNTQKRTLGIRESDWSKIVAWSQYMLWGENGKQGVFPAANVLTRDVKVQQGLLFDCYINCNLYHNNWMFNLGYNYFSRAAEDVSVKCWPNNTYARAYVTYDTTTPFDVTKVSGTDRHAQDDPVQKDMLNTSVAANPASITHKFYGLIGGTFNSIRVPVTVALGGAYEFCQDNAALEGYELYVKAGISF